MVSADIDQWIKAEVERSFAGEPALRDPSTYALRGRRAQRTRRAAYSALGIASIAVAVPLALGGSHGATAPDRAIRPAGPAAVVPVQVTTPVPVDPETAKKCAAGSLGKCGPGISWDDVHIDYTGQLLRGYDDVRISGRYDDVLPAGYRTSIALEVTSHGRTVWALLSSTDPDSTELKTTRPDPTRTFDAWVRDSVATGHWFDYRADPDGPGEGATPR